MSSEAGSENPPYLGESTKPDQNSARTVRDNGPYLAPSEKDGGEDEEGLEDQAGAGGEGISSPEVATVVETVDGFQEFGRILAKVANAGAVVGKH